MVNRAQLLRSLDLRPNEWQIAVAAVAAALGVQLSLAPITADAPFLLFFGAIALSAWLGGVRAGILATGLSVLVAELSLAPPYWHADLSLAWWVRIGIFFAEGVFISVAAQRQTSATGSTVSLARGGAPELEARPVRISAVIREVMTSMQPDAVSKGVRLETVIDHGVGAVQGTPQCPRQVVASLVSNAIRSTPTGGRVCVRVRRRRDDVEVSVVDTGQGIAEPEIERIFLPHGPAAGSLARARQQIRMQGGDLTAFSAGPGTGATFTLHLRRRQLFAPSAREAVQQIAV